MQRSAVQRRAERGRAEQGWAVQGRAVQGGRAGRQPEEVIASAGGASPTRVSSNKHTPFLRHFARSPQFQQRNAVGKQNENDVRMQNLIVDVISISFRHCFHCCFGSVFIAFFRYRFEIVLVARYFDIVYPFCSLCRLPMMPPAPAARVRAGRRGLTVPCRV